MKSHCHVLHSLEGEVVERSQDDIGTTNRNNVTRALERTISRENHMGMT